MDIYKELGYNDRKDYIVCKADEYNVDVDYAMAIADLMGPSEDFDGFINMLEDFNFYVS